MVQQIRKVILISILLLGAQHHATAQTNQITIFPIQGLDFWGDNVDSLFPIFYDAIGPANYVIFQNSDSLVSVPEEELHSLFPVKMIPMDTEGPQVYTMHFVYEGQNYAVPVTAYELEPPPINTSESPRNENQEDDLNDIRPDYIIVARRGAVIFSCSGEHTDAENKDIHQGDNNTIPYWTKTYGCKKWN